MGAYEYGAPPYVDVDDNVIVQTPEVFLHQNYPNPFNPITTISFSIPNNSKIELSIYNIKGHKVKTLSNSTFNKGNHSVIWKGEDNLGKSVSSGIYFYKLKVSGKTEAVKKCLLLK
jgi:flagellar hook assembly protein FlgD